MALNRIRNLPLGYSQVLYANKIYGVTRTDFNNGNSIKLYAEELGGKNFISLNYYITSKQEFLKPCEMPTKKVIHFLDHFKLINEL